MRPFAACAADYMDMGTAVRMFEKPGNEDIVFFEHSAADRADPVAVSPETVYAALDVHQPVLAPV